MVKANNQMDKQGRRDLKNSDGNNIRLNLKINKKDFKTKFKKILGIVKKMVRNDVNDYTEVEKKKIGKLDVEKGMRIRFVDDKDK